MSYDLKRCPQCGVSQPAVSWRCACGYAFAGTKDVETEISRAFDTRQSRRKIMEDHCQRSMSAAEAARVMNIVKAKCSKWRQEIRQHYIAIIVAAVVCFVVCWVSTIIIVVAYTWRGTVIRLIAARQAKAREQNQSKG